LLVLYMMPSAHARRKIVHTAGRLEEWSKTGLAMQGPDFECILSSLSLAAWNGRLDHDGCYSESICFTLLLQICCRKRGGGVRSYYSLTPCLTAALVHCKIGDETDSRQRFHCYCHFSDSVLPRPTLRLGRLQAGP
jgi:hypothetical protein